MFYDSREVPDFKKDGYEWQKRKDGSGRVCGDQDGCYGICAMDALMIYHVVW